MVYMNDTKTPKRTPMDLLTAKYVHGLLDNENTDKRLAEKMKSVTEELENIKKRMASNKESRLRGTIEYGSGIARNFTESKKPLALYVMISFFKNEDGHDLSSDEVKAGTTVKASRLLMNIESGLSANSRILWIDRSKPRTDLNDTLAYLEANGFVKCSTDLSSANFDGNTEVQLTGNGALAARALREYIAAKRDLERKQ